jgi:hypothetical protein
MLFASHPIGRTSDFAKSKNNILNKTILISVGLWFPQKTRKNHNKTLHIKALQNNTRKTPPNIPIIL